MLVAGNRSIVFYVPASCETEEEAKGQWRFLSVMDDQEVVTVTALPRNIGRTGKSKKKGRIIGCGMEKATMFSNFYNSSICPF